MTILRIFVFFTLLILSIHNVILGQSTQINLKQTGSENSQISTGLLENEEILIDRNGRIVGVCSGTKEDNQKLFNLKFQTGNNFKIVPYQFMKISDDISRVVTFGEYIEFDVFNKLYINIHDENGNTISSFDSKLNWPYALDILSNGDIVVIGSDNDKGISYLKSFNSLGDELWQTIIKSASDYKIKVSQNGNYIVLLSRDGEKFKRELQIFNTNGIELYQESHPEDFYNFDFLTDKMLIVFSASSWILYDLQNDISRLGSGRLDGKPAGNYPVSALNNGLQFAFLLVSDNKTGYNLNIFDSNTGYKISSESIVQKPYLHQFRSITSVDPNALKVNLGRKTISYTFE